MLTTGPWYSPDFWSADLLGLPSFLLMGVVILITVLGSNDRYRWRWIVVLLVAFLSFRYIGWRIFATVNGEDGVWIFAISVLFLIAELYVFSLNSLSTWAFYLFRTNHSKQADEYQKAIISGEFNPDLDIFIPTYNEPVEIIRQTVAGCFGLYYPDDKKHIYILDDGRRPEMRALAEELGVGYFDRPDNSHYKAGNINNALPQTNSPYIMFLDADFVPAPYFIQRVLGFFQDPKMAIVQTPLNFHNDDLIQCNLGLSSSVSSEQDLFFRGIQPGRDAFNVVICCGSSWIGRRDLLEHIGGVPTDTITEDLMTSYFMQAMGYKVRYLNEALTFGEASNRTSDHLKQRVRWCRGVLQTLFIEKNPMTCEGLSWVQRFFYLVTILYWTTNIPRFVLILLPLLYFYFGIIPIKAPIQEVFSYFLPFYIASLALISWFNRGRRSPLWSDVYEFTSSFAIIPNLIHAFVDPFGLGFKVTPKGVTNNSIIINWEVALPSLIILSLFVIALIKMFLTMEWMTEPNALILNFYWSVYSIIIFWLVFMISIDVPQRRTDTRFNLNVPFQVKVKEQIVQGETLDMAQGGFSAKLPDELTQVLSAKDTKEQRLQAKLRMPTIFKHHVIPITIEKRRCKQELGHEDRLFVRFPKLSMKLYTLLITGLFKGLADVWETKTITTEWRYTWLFFKSALRMYPLSR